MVKPIPMKWKHVLYEGACSRVLSCWFCAITPCCSTCQIIILCSYSLTIMPPHLVPDHSSRSLDLESSQLSGGLETVNAVYISVNHLNYPTYPTFPTFPTFPT